MDFSRICSNYYKKSSRVLFIGRIHSKRNETQDFEAAILSGYDINSRVGGCHIKWI